MILGEGVLHDGVVFIGAEDKAEGGVVIRGAAFAVVVVHVKLELPEVLVGEFPDLQIDEDVALQNGVIEDEVNVEVVAIEGESLLAGEEGKAATEFEQEGLELGNEGVFKIGFDEFFRFRETEEFDDDGILEDIGRLLRPQPLIGETEQTLLVAGFGEPLKKQGIDLAVEFPRGPAVAEGFNLVKCAGRRVGGLEKGPIVGP